MGRTPKFPPLPPKEGQEVSLTVIPKALTPETEADRKREIALLARVKLDDNFDGVVDRIFALPETSMVGDAESPNLEVMKLKIDTVKWLADRGYGKAPQIVKLGTDEGTPQHILEQIAKKRTDALVEKMEADRLRAEAVTTEVEKEAEPS